MGPGAHLSLPGGHYSLSWAVLGAYQLTAWLWTLLILAHRLISQLDLTMALWPGFLAGPSHHLQDCLLCSGTGGWGCPCLSCPSGSSQALLLPDNIWGFGSLCSHTWLLGRVRLLSSSFGIKEKWSTASYWALQGNWSQVLLLLITINELLSCGTGSVC